MSRPLGIIVYQGESQIDKKPVIAVATGIKEKTENVKTGNLIQIWILRPDIPPLLATKIGEDYSICGDCKHRHFGSCYVNLAHGPEHVFKAYHRQRYVKLSSDNISLFNKRHLRIGAYGDPACVPIEIWDKLCNISHAYTGYTHQWKKCNQALKNYCMASADTIREYYQARELGWRTFRIRTNDIILSDEFICPASTEKEHKITCEQCMACMGTFINKSKCPTIKVHGVDFKVKRFNEGMKKIRNKKKYKKNFIKI